MQAASIPLDLGLLAFLDTLCDSGNLEDRDDIVLAALERRGHKFNARELAVVKDFAITCAYVNQANGALSCTKIGRTRLETALHRAPRGL